MEVLSYERTTHLVNMIHVCSSILLLQIDKDIKVQQQGELSNPSALDGLNKVNALSGGMNPDKMLRRNLQSRLFDPGHATHQTGTTSYGSRTIRLYLNWFLDLLSALVQSVLFFFVVKVFVMSCHESNTAV